MQKAAVSKGDSRFLMTMLFLSSNLKLLEFTSYFF